MYLTGQQYVITNNIIYDTPSGWGLQCAGYTAADYPSNGGPNYLGFTGTIANNTIAYGRNDGAIVIYMPGAVNTIIENNIFYEGNQSNYNSNANAVDFYSAGTGHVLRNNLSYATSPGATAFVNTGTAGVTYTQSGNLVNVSNPAFVNGPSTMPTSPDFRLQSGSPAIDRGLSLPLVTVDFAGAPRPQGSGYDIGAYEGDSSNVPPAAPQGLVAR
jgi:hypothetical protein